jgi:hypothetical protein
MATTRWLDRGISQLCACIWLLAVGAGMCVLLDHATRPGRAGTASRRWPGAVDRVPGRAMLVMAVHPHCPCSRASIRELELIMCACQGRLDARLLFVAPAGLGADWMHTDLWDAARAIPGVEVMGDLGGGKARLFGVLTSGHVLLYGGSGALLFSGGITPARGHSGDNTGRDTIVSLLTDGIAPAPGRAGVCETLVFGCPLFDPPVD